MIISLLYFPMFQPESSMVGMLLVLTFGKQSYEYRRALLRYQRSKFMISGVAHFLRLSLINDKLIVLSGQLQL